jgi:hypothetical protein
MGEHDNAVLTGRYTRSDDDKDIDDHRSLYPVSPEGAGAGSYAPGADLPKVHVFLYTNDKLVADVFHTPDSQFDFTEWESKYMLRPIFKAEFGNAFYPWNWNDSDAILEWDSYAESTFTPVVKDGNDTVIAHVGYVLATDVAIPRTSSIHDLSRSGRDVAQWKKYLSEQVNNYLAQGGVAYVAPRPDDDTVESGDQKWAMYHLKEDAFLVLVDPNGQILQVLEVIQKRPKGVGTMALEFIGFALDVLTILDLAAIGISVSLIAARGARSGLKKILSLVLRETPRMTSAHVLTDAEIEQLIKTGAIRRFSIQGVPQLPPALRTPTFANKLAAVQKARDLAAVGIDEYGVIVNANNELVIGRGGPRGILFPKKAEVVSHSHVPGIGEDMVSPQDIATLPSDGASEFFIDTKGRIHIVGKPAP